MTDVRLPTIRTSVLAQLPSEVPSVNHSHPNIDCAGNKLVEMTETGSVVRAVQCVADRRAEGMPLHCQASFVVSRLQGQIRAVR
jgi:hypothetical protein